MTVTVADVNDLLFVNSVGVVEAKSRAHIIDSLSNKYLKLSFLNPSKKRF